MQSINTNVPIMSNVSFQCFQHPVQSKEDDLACVYSPICLEPCTSSRRFYTLKWRPRACAVRFLHCLFCTCAVHLFCPMLRQLRLTLIGPPNCVGRLRRRRTQGRRRENWVTGMSGLPPYPFSRQTWYLPPPSLLPCVEKHAVIFLWK